MSTLDFEQLQKSWQHLGATDPRWAILSEPSRKDGGGDDASFWQSGQGVVGWLSQHLAGLGVVPFGGRALDFGCGHGRLTQALAPHFNAVVGIDIAESMVEAARLANKHGDRVTYLHNPRPDLSQFADGSFDFILTMLVLQHMRSEFAKSYLREFMRILRPGGLAFFQLPIESLTPAPQAGKAVSAATQSIAASDLWANNALLPTRMGFVADEFLWLRVDVRNDGPQVLRAGAGPGCVEVGLRFQRLDLSVVQPPVWVPLPHDIKPGERAQVVTAVRAPSAAGWYVLAALPAVARNWCEHPRNVAANQTVQVDPAAPTRTAPPAEPPPRPAYQDPARVLDSLIEVHGTPMAEIDAILRTGGAELLDVGLDGWAGYEWVSAHFVVRKR